VEVPSNLGNSVDALAHWLNNMMDIKAGPPTTCSKRPSTHVEPWYTDQMAASDVILATCGRLYTPGIPAGAETESQYRDTVAELHAHVFQNYLHWGEYTGMLHAAGHRAALQGGAHAERDMVLAAFMSADIDGQGGS